MSIVRNITAIAKGMSITFKEMLEPTQVENYPDGPGPLRGAKFEQRFRGAHELQRDENGLEKWNRIKSTSFSSTYSNPEKVASWSSFAPSMVQIA